MLRRIAPAVSALLLLVSAASAQTAHYRVTFETTWTAETHPQSYPPSPHFSGLVGGTHAATADFWEPGSLASLGIKRMAEWGSQTELLAEVQAAITAGDAWSTLTDPPLWTVPGSTAFEFEIDPGFPLVTLVAMIAPSPDWFVGVDGLDLRPGGSWVESVSVDLYPWDSGTDSGAIYTSGDAPTAPPVPIFAAGAPFAAGVPIGTFTFTRLYVSDVPRTVEPLSTTAAPNPFNPSTEIAWEAPANGRLVVEIVDLRGRRVRTLHDASVAAGPGRVSWDGRDDSGRSVNSGAYLFRVRQNDAVVAGRLTLVK